MDRSTALNPVCQEIRWHSGPKRSEQGRHAKKRVQSANNLLALWTVETDQSEADNLLALWTAETGESEAR
jgi:hypothetical protein